MAMANSMAAIKIAAPRSKPVPRQTRKCRRWTSCNLSSIAAGIGVALFGAFKWWVPFLDVSLIRHRVLEHYRREAGMSKHSNMSFRLSFDDRGERSSRTKRAVVNLGLSCQTPMLPCQPLEREAADYNPKIAPPVPSGLTLKHGLLHVGDGLDFGQRRGN